MVFSNITFEMTSFFDTSVSKSDEDDDIIICEVRSERELALVILFLFESVLLLLLLLLAAGSKLTKADSFFSMLTKLATDEGELLFERFIVLIFLFFKIESSIESSFL
jgi:hypothetical protein